jgi:small subunit ribosomal protein S15
MTNNKTQTSTKTKADVIADFRTNDLDTGSSEVQIALLTRRINYLTEHFKSNPKDFGSKRGLLKLVGQRRRFLSYVERHDAAKYKELLERLSLRK